MALYTEDIYTTMKPYTEDFHTTMDYTLKTFTQPWTIH